MERGRIVKALSGFYYVDSGNGTLTQCRARGRFRKERMSPLVGDWVRFFRLRRTGHGRGDRAAPQQLYPPGRQ